MVNTNATDRQKKYMKELGIAFSKDITKTQATKLISQSIEPSAENKAILKRFGESVSNEWEAREKIKLLFSDPKNVTKWENRPAAKRDKLLIEHMEQKRFSRLSHKKATQLISDYYENPDLEKKADAFLDEMDREEDEKEERKDIIQMIHESINDEPSFFGLVKVSKKQTIAAVKEVEIKQKTGIVKLWDDQSRDETDLVAKQLLSLFPEKQRKTSQRGVDIQKLEKNTGCSIFLPAGIFLFGVLTSLFNQHVS